MDRNFFCAMAETFFIALWIFSTLKFLADAYATLMFGIGSIATIFGIIGTSSFFISE